MFAAICVAESHRVHAVDGNLVFAYEVALDCFSQALGTLDASAARTGRVRFHFKDVAFAPGKAGSQLIKLCLRVGGKHRAPGAEGDFSFGDLLVLIESVDGRIDAGPRAAMPVAPCCWRFAPAVLAAIAAWLAASAED